MSHMPRTILLRLPRHSKITDITKLAEDKDSSVVIMNKKDYVTKVQGMIDDGIVTGKYTTSVDTILNNINNIHIRLYCCRRPSSWGIQQSANESHFC